MTVAGESQVPVGDLLGRAEADPSGWQKWARWRDWNLPTKLAALTLIPLLMALTLGSVVLVDRIQRSDQDDQVNRLAEFEAATGKLLDELARERAITVGLLTQGTADSPDLRSARSDVDDVADSVREAAVEAEHATEEGVDPRQKIDEQLQQLAELRQGVDTGQKEPIEAVTDYSVVTGTLLDLDGTIVASVDGALADHAQAVHELRAASDAASAQQAMVEYGIQRGTLTPSTFNEVRTSSVLMQERIDEFRTVAPEALRQSFDVAVHGEVFDDFSRTVKTILLEQGGGGEALNSLTAQHWDDVAGTFSSSLTETNHELADDLVGSADRLAADSSTKLVLLIVGLLLFFVLAALVVFVITRQLLRSLESLRSNAIHIAEQELPAAVYSIREEEQADTPRIRPLPIHTRDEVGEAARAFDTIHHEALRLAEEQVAMRSNYANVFINLSRRSQSLVQRQLHMIESLERDEEDADHLASLFQLDHLATRMRRNNENLMVLSGAEPGRRSNRPVNATDVLRAAVSEIEQYQRVTFSSPPEVDIVGYAAGGLIRLIAELLDNATAFSAPETRVTVAMRLLSEGSLVIDVLDRGIGMNGAELSEANQRLHAGGSADMVTSRRMGLFVVGRLSARYGCRVALYGGADIAGVRATVTVPADLIRNRNASTTHKSRSSSGTVPDSVEQQNIVADSSASEPLPSRRHYEGQPNGERRTSSGVGDKTSSVWEPASSVPQDQDEVGSPDELSGPALFAPADQSHQELPQTTTDRQSPSSGESVVRTSPAPDGSPSPSSRNGSEAKKCETTTTGREGTGSTTSSVADAGKVDPGAETETTEESEAVGSVAGYSFAETDGTVIGSWWNGSATDDSKRSAEQAAVEDAETTPIFDAMVSVWFRSISNSDHESSGQEWTFSADEEWRTVRELAKRPVSGHTDAGLPQRQQGEQLLPGSAAHQHGTPPCAGEEPERPVRDPAAVRNRLNSYQEGVHRGRQWRTVPPTGPPAATQDPETSIFAVSEDSCQAPVDETRHSQQGTDYPGGNGAVTTGTTDVHDSRVGGVLGAGEPGVAGAFEGAIGTGRPDTPDREIREPRSSSYTSTGLPRRQRGERLPPGGTASSENPMSSDNPLREAARERDPAAVRGRLNSFQQGVRRGRHRDLSDNDSSRENVEDE